MKKVSIIYWSNGGNVEIIANAICEGASIGDVEVETKHVADASTEDVLEADAVAFGSPAMINDDIEEIDSFDFEDLDIDTNENHSFYNKDRQNTIHTYKETDYLEDEEDEDDDLDNLEFPEDGNILEEEEDEII